MSKVVTVKRQFAIFILFVSLNFLSQSMHAKQAVAPNSATGYVRVKQIDGIWWFIGPDGDRFVSLGVNHVEPHLWLAPYNKDATLKRYGQDMVSADGHFNTHGQAARKWIDRQAAICRDLNFNTFGPHTHPTIDTRLYRDQVYYIASLQTGPLAGWRERNGEGPRPDVFSLDFRDFIEARVQAVCTEHKDSRRLLGYLYTDVPSWVMGRADQKKRNNSVMIYPWINAILPLGEASPGKWKWLEHLQTRYASPEDAARVWGLPVSPTYGISWNRMARLNTWFNPADPKTANADMVSFMHLIADRWYGLHHDLIRKYDPNHLLLGDKNWITWHHEWVLPALKKHVDVVAIQAYDRWDVDGKVTGRIYAATGKPIFNGDGSHGFVGPHQQEHGVKGFRTGAQSYQEVADLYQETLKGMMAAPYMIGWHHCGCLQQWDAAERGDSPRNENGFMDPFENYHTVWTDVIREVNGRAVAWHEAARNGG